MKKILMILTMALAATSCMDILDVAPEDQIASENMWTTEEPVSYTHLTLPTKA